MIALVNIPAQQKAKHALTGAEVTPEAAAKLVADHLEGSLAVVGLR